MATGAYTGLTGYVKVAGVTYCIDSGSVTREADLIDVTSTCSSGTAEYLPGIKRGSGSFSSFNYIPVSPSDLVAIEMGNDAVVVTGSAYVQQTMDQPLNEAIKWNYDFTFSGVVYWNAAEA